MKNEDANIRKVMLTLPVHERGGWCDRCSSQACERHNCYCISQLLDTDPIKVWTEFLADCDLIFFFAFDI